MYRITKLLLTITPVLLLGSCWDLGKRGSSTMPDLRKVWGYKPVYSSDTTLQNVRALPPEPVKNAGKVYVKGNLIFQNEIGKGIHVLDKSNPMNIINRGFIQIRGNTELTFKGVYLYANSFSDLLVVDVTNWQAPVQVSKIKNAFLIGSNQSFNLYLPPPQRNTYYECVNYYKGVHTGWVQDSIFAACYYN